MGSSHAVNHFYPEIIEKQTGLSCYNAGVEGQRLLFVQALEEIILKRYHPKILILNIEPYYLVTFKRAYNMIVDLYPYYFKYPDIVGRLANLKSPYEKYKLMSVLYQYNPSVAYIIYYLFHNQKDYKGFVPLYGVIPEYQRKSDIEKDIEISKNEALDTILISTFNRFIKIAQESGTKLVFVLSPIAVKSDISQSVSYLKIKEIAKSNKIPILDYYNDTAFLEKYQLFDAKTHLNIKGAEVFSEIFSKDIMKTLEK